MKFLADFFPVLLFFVAYKLYGIFVATGIAILASLLQVGIQWLRSRRVQTMHLVTLGLLVVFGGLTILLQDKTFIMWKPSIVNWLFAAVFLGSLFIGDKSLIERMMGQSIEAPQPVWRRLNHAWTLFFLAMGGLNLLIAYRFFTAEQALSATTKMQDVDLGQCETLFDDTSLALCLHARAMEEDWVNFKLFGMMGLTFAFVILQAFYLARHMKEPDKQVKET
ncbi:MAG TPA: septation protein A [Chromatiales bacterium]|nr:septation protein A [Chromatiales bacterium]